MAFFSATGLFSSCKSGPRPPRGSHATGWVGPTALLCIYGFSSMMRPIEPFLTEFLTGAYKNLTTGQITRQVYPVWTYSSVILLIPVFLVTDLVRYKPVIVLQALVNFLAFLLILVCRGVKCMQFAFFIYGVSSAADVAYFSYIYSLVEPGRYQKVTSYVRAAVLVGYATGALLGQLLVSIAGVALYYLDVVSLVSLGVALLTSLLLPMPRKGLFQRETSHSRSNSGSQDLSMLQAAARYVMGTVRRLVLDCKECYSSIALLFFCVWSATGRCGFYQVVNYVQVLWVSTQPQQNFTAYNGAVDAFTTLSGAAASLAVGHVSVEWSSWGELVLGGFTFLMAGALFLMALTDDIWLSYACFAVFKALYMQLTTICTFQIAKKLRMERLALVFGVNSFVGMALQSVLTAVVINTRSLRLTITTQFFVYASYFGALALLFTARGVYTAVSARRSPANARAERHSHLPEVRG